MNALRLTARTVLGTICAATLFISTHSCFDDSELRDSLDDLAGRVEALEDFQERIQTDLGTLKDLIQKLESLVSVNNVVEGENGYTINFSDGTSITINDGQHGQDGLDGQDGLTPPTIIIIEEDGTYYWGYEYPDGSREFITDDAGNKIPVTGDSPEIRINDGRWEVSVDGGVTWKDAGPATGTGSGESIFKEIGEDEDFVYITLHDGTEIVLPKTRELVFDFGTQGNTLYFETAESKTLQYTMSGVETVSISKPDGWKASIEQTGFVITAPSAENTYAETEGNIEVFATAPNGLSIIVKQPVAIGEGPDGQSFEITLGEITSTTAEVTIIPAIKDEYYRVIAFRSDLPDESVLGMMIDDVTAYVNEYGWEQSIANGLFFIGDNRNVVFDGFPDGQTARFYVVGIDYQNGVPVATTGIYKSDEFTTPKIPESDAWVNMTPGYMYQDGTMILYTTFSANETAKEVKAAVWYVFNGWGDPVNLQECGYNESGIRATLMGEDATTIDMENEGYLATAVSPGEARLIGVLGFDENGIPGKPNWIVLKAPMEPDGTYAILCQSDDNETGLNEPYPDMTIDYALYLGIDPLFEVECPAISVEFGPNELCADYHWSVEEYGYYYSYGGPDNIEAYLTYEGNRWDDETGWGWRCREDTNDGNGQPTDKDDIPLGTWFSGSYVDLIYVCFDDRGVAADPLYISFYVPYEFELEPKYIRADVSVSRIPRNARLIGICETDMNGYCFRQTTQDK